MVHQMREEQAVVSSEEACWSALGEDTLGNQDRCERLARSCPCSFAVALDEFMKARGQ